MRTRPASAVIDARRYQVVSRGAMVGVASSGRSVASADSGSSDANAGSRWPAAFDEVPQQRGRRLACGPSIARCPSFCFSSRQASADSTGASSSDAAIAYSRRRSRRAIGPSHDRKYSESSVSK